MAKDECDHLDAGINQAFRDGAVFSFLSLSHLLAAFPGETRSLLDEIIGKGAARTGPYRVVLVQTSELPDGKMFLRQPGERHDSSCIIIALESRALRRSTSKNAAQPWTQVPLVIRKLEMQSTTPIRERVSKHRLLLIGLHLRLGIEQERFVSCWQLLAVFLFAII